ncbi:TetR/AcrR family transcriptional regulator [Rhodopila sp.]|jgi:AcrR family transcriptional regulator|uniref:TetR/AcrR family transcriptional regulator n=1 Tax=Rhodopila sp. TaxID=2480087 RepID=UPI002D061F1B|nr:TetR family transcriptional regulator [Rhodopila sp.]HVZ08926.1 TetR family transcriptional regulator [Rhodopila sp.]
MLDEARPLARERWLEIAERAAAGCQAGPRDPKQSRSRRRQLDLLEAATRVFARDGIAKAKMADIATEAGISVSSIYDYYPSKEDLAYEIPIRRLAQFYAEFLAEGRALTTMRERLRLFLRMAAEYAARNPDWARLLYLEIWPSVLIEEARVRSAIDDFGRIVVALVRDGADRGEWSRELDPYQIATILMGSITHMIITWLLYGRPADLAGAAPAMVSQLLRLVDTCGDWTSAA